MSVARWIACAFVLAVAATSPADEPPANAPPRENKVSAAARAAMDAYAKLVYRPAEHGLVSASGSVVVDKDDAARPMHFELVPPARLSAGPAADTKRPRYPSLIRLLAELPLRAALEGMPMTESDAYDADLVERGGARVVTVATRDNGTDNPVSEFTLDADGLVSSWRRSPALDTPTTHWFEFTATFKWAKAGDLRRVEHIDLSGTDNGKKPFHAVFSLAYADVAGVTVLASYAERISTTDRKRSSTFRVDELTLNGARAELPGPPFARHVTPEAKAILDRYAKLVYRPGEHGLASYSCVMPDWDTSCGAMKLSFAAGKGLSVALASGERADSRRTAVAMESLRRMVLPAFQGASPIWNWEYDAEVVERDGRKIVVVKEIDDDETACVCDVSFDATGLIESTRDRTGAEPGAPRAEVTVRYQWTKTGGLYRVASAEIVYGAPGARQPTYTFDYAAIGGIEVLRGFADVRPDAAGVRQTHAFRLEAIVVNGKPVDPSPPDAGKK